jgi:hypothetical protein
MYKFPRNRTGGSKRFTLELGVVVYVYNPRTQEVEARELKVPGQPVPFLPFFFWWHWGLNLGHHAC